MKNILQIVIILIICLQSVSAQSIIENSLGYPDVQWENILQNALIAVSFNDSVEESPGIHRIALWPIRLFKTDEEVSFTITKSTLEQILTQPLRLYSSEFSISDIFITGIDIDDYDEYSINKIFYIEIESDTIIPSNTIAFIGDFHPLTFFDLIGDSSPFRLEDPSKIAAHHAASYEKYRRSDEYYLSPIEEEFFKPTIYTFSSGNWTITSEFLTLQKRGIEYLKLDWWWGSEIDYQFGYSKLVFKNPETNSYFEFSFIDFQYSPPKEVDGYFPTSTFLEMPFTYYAISDIDGNAIPEFWLSIPARGGGHYELFIAAGGEIHLIPWY
jgi:hypothetical protein